MAIALSFGRGRPANRSAYVLGASAATARCPSPGRARPGRARARHRSGPRRCRPGTPTSGGSRPSGRGSRCGRGRRCPCSSRRRSRAGARRGSPARRGRAHRDAPATSSPRSGRSAARSGPMRSGRALSTNRSRSSVRTSAADGMPSAAGISRSATAAKRRPLGRHRAPRAGRRPRCRRHAGTCCSNRVSTMWSAARSAIATIVEVGFTPDEVTKHEPSTTYRFGTSWARFQRSTHRRLRVVAHPRGPEQVPARVPHQPVDLDLVGAGRLHRLLRPLDVEVEHPARVVGHRVVDLRRRDARTSP